ncbi:MAG: SDR family NAD(P)-dependent oxidoreductase [Cyclobacteriaceae bacterium]
MQQQSLYIITGASKGLGKALVDTILERDSNNEVMGISRTRLNERRNFTHYAIDLSDTQKLISLLGDIFPLANYQRVVLINNAGWIGEIAHNGYLDPLSIRKIHEVNVIAPAILMNAFMKTYDKFRGEKLIINISSGAASKVMDGWSGYSASKAALNQLTKVAQHESDRRNRGFQLFALSPGIIDTPMQETIRSVSEENFSNISKFRSFKENNELSTPEDTAEKVWYLIRNHASFKEVLQDVRQF